MSIFPTVLFIHVLSSMALFATFALEATVLLRIRSARNADQVYAGVLTFERLRRIAIPTFLGLLVGGGYLGMASGKPGFLRLSLRRFSSCSWAGL